MIAFASRFLPAADELHDGGGIRFQGGKIVAVYRSHASVQRALRVTGDRPLDLGDGVLAPGLVNAHAHLDLTALEGRLRARGRFVPWIGSILKLRAPLAAADFERAVRSGARRLLQTGTTAVGDIDSSGCGASARLEGLRCVVYREVLDAWDAVRTGPALARLARKLARHSLVNEGVSPHAPYTTSPDLLDGIRRLAARRSLPVAMHWSETEEEVAWMTLGTGPFRRVFPALRGGPGVSGLDLLERAGLLGGGTTLIHGNHPLRGEPARLARAGVSLVHCPGTHAFFGRDAFPWRRYQRAGVRLALGTDSLASNDALDMRRETARALEGLPGLSPERAWRMATRDAAHAVGLGRSVGELRRGYAADFVAYAGIDDARRGSRTEVLEALTHGAGRVRAVRVAGRPIRLPDESGRR